MIFNLDCLFGKRNGIINELIQTYVDEYEPEIFSFAATRGFFDWEGENKDQALNIAGGGGLTKMEALVSCCGEIVERYCSSFMSGDEIEGSYNNLKHKGHQLINPEQFNHFSDSQYISENFSFEKISKDSELIWTKMLKNGKEEIYVPAFLVYLPFNDFEKGGKYFFSLSTGLACSDTLEKAYQKGILEIIERDAFTNFWINKLSPPHINLPDDPKFNDLKQKFKFDDIEYIILDITSDFGIPVVAIFSFSEASFGYSASLGLACDFTYYGAVRKALIENAQGRVANAYNKKVYEGKRFRTDFLDVMSFKDHSYLYSTDKNLRNQIKFIENGRKIELQENEKRYGLEDLISLFTAKSFDVYLKDLTTEDVRDRVGFYTGKVVIPGMTHLHGIHAYPFLGSKRLYKPCEVFDWCDIKESKEEDIKNFPPHLLG